MYQFINAICLSRSIGSQWHEVNLSNVLVFDIYTTYSKVFLILSNPNIPTDVYVDFDILKLEFINYEGTLNQLLVDLADRTLATVDSIPSTTVKSAKYSDAFRSFYKIDLTKIGVVTPDNYPQSELNDIAITRPSYKTDISLLHTHCLLSVNGYYHFTATDNIKSYIYDGVKSLRKSNSNQIGILSFLDIGELTKLKLDPNLIYAQDNTSTLSDRIYFDINEDLTNKSYFLVLGGYLVFPSENVFWQSGEKTFALNINMIPYPERIYESSIYLDLTDLQLSNLLISPDAISTQELFSDAVLKRYLTLSQSYFVIVDKPNLITNKLDIRHSNLPGMFTSYQDPVLPLIVNYGKAAEYWKTFEDGFWSVTVQDSFFRNFILSEQPIYQQTVINQHLLSNVPFQHSRGYLLEILGY